MKDSVRRKHAFTEQEDEQLLKLVSYFGDRDNWKVIANNIPGRTQRQCRERYKTYLAPDINTSYWTEEEDEILKEKYIEFGPKWSVISSFIKGRSSNSVKNRFNNHINKNGKFLATIPQIEESKMSDNEITKHEEIAIIIKPMPIIEKRVPIIRERLPPISFLDSVLSASPSVDQSFSFPKMQLIFA